LSRVLLLLTGLVHNGTEQAKGMAHRLAGHEVPDLSDTEASFGELLERIEKVRAMLAGCKAEEFVGAESRTITIKMRSGEVSFPGLAYLHRYGMPNFYFHMTTAYNILRHNGVPLGKPDFLGNR
jgi:hypothetical protein